MIDKKSTGANTIIGDTIVIRGNVQGDEDLTIKGRIEGNITLTKDLFIETSGIVKADVNVQNIFVSGVLVGNVTASQLVEISADGRMVGNISAPRVVIVDGASYRGRIEMGEAAEGARAVVRPRHIPRPAPRPFAPRIVPTPAAPAAPARPGQPGEQKPAVSGMGAPKPPEGKGPEMKPPAPAGMPSGLGAKPANAQQTTPVKKEEPSKK